MHTQCVFCGHKHIQPVQTQYIYRHNGKFLIVNDVPCLQCTYCGEQYFEGHILRNISPFAQSISSILNFKLSVERSPQPQPLQDVLLHP
ncbi:YgiT-type zinc finger protein [Candidatus Microgenomates bacterium]|nr:YgiT-type zinc finger protein [Candidatus Microgenomates bacterium]